MNIGRELDDECSTSGIVQASSVILGSLSTSSSDILLCGQSTFKPVDSNMYVSMESPQIRRTVTLTLTSERRYP